MARRSFPIDEPLPPDTTALVIHDVASLEKRIAYLESTVLVLRSEIGAIKDGLRSLPAQLERQLGILDKRRIPGAAL